MVDHTNALRELRALYRVSQAVNQSLHLGEIVEGILAILAEDLGMQRGTLTLLDPETGELAIEVAHGLSPSEKKRGRYRVGEGITGRVLETGQAMAVPNIGEEPLFLDRTGARRDLDRFQVAFLCVPVVVGKTPVGVLSADRLSPEGADLEEDLRLLTIVAGVVAQAVRIQQMVRREKARLADENRHLRRALEGAYRLDSMVGTSAAMQAVYEQVHLVAKSRATVLITGESGTGKELVAKAIHFNSDRNDKPFIRLACASLPESLLESELFGHEPGAFTGAVSAQPGRFELAHGGTVFLDEVAEISLGLQVKLLRVLQEREFERVGGRQTRHADVRVIAATNRDLAREVREGRFREDLYYRLNVVPIHLPPLRDRRQDVALLAHHFLERYRRENRREIRGFTAEAVALLTRHGWPGNVRELENTIERAVVMARGEVIEAADLPLDLAGPGGAPGGEREGVELAVTRLADRLLDAPPPEGVYRAVLDRVERTLVERAVARTNGVRLQAARLLGINRNTLYSKMERWSEP